MLLADTEDAIARQADQLECQVSSHRYGHLSSVSAACQRFGSDWARDSRRQTPRDSAPEHAALSRLYQRVGMCGKFNLCGVRSDAGSMTVPTGLLASGHHGFESGAVLGAVKILRSAPTPLPRGLADLDDACAQLGDLAVVVMADYCT